MVNQAGCQTQRFTYYPRRSTEGQVLALLGTLVLIEALARGLRISQKHGSVRGTRPETSSAYTPPFALAS
ncbi:MAG TPA: hypothetical protein VF598_08790 [Hymenobacter sp.]